MGKAYFFKGNIKAETDSLKELQQRHEDMLKAFREHGQSSVFENIDPTGRWFNYSENKRQHERSYTQQPNIKPVIIHTPILERIMKVNEYGNLKVSFGKIEQAEEFDIDATYVLHKGIDKVIVQVDWENQMVQISNEGWFNLRNVTFIDRRLEQKRLSIFTNK